MLVGLKWVNTFSNSNVTNGDQKEIKKEGRILWPKFSKASFAFLIPIALILRQKFWRYESLLSPKDIFASSLVRTLTEYTQLNLKLIAFTREF